MYFNTGGFTFPIWSNCTCFALNRPLFHCITKGGKLLVQKGAAAGVWDVWVRADVCHTQSTITQLTLKCTFIDQEWLMHTFAGAGSHARNLIYVTQNGGGLGGITFSQGEKRGELGPGEICWDYRRLAGLQGGEGGVHSGWRSQRPKNSPVK